MHEVFKRNLGYKIVSLLLAILFWLWVTNQNQASSQSSQTINGNQEYNVPLVTKNLPVNSMIMTKLPSVRVQLQGSNPSVNVKDLYAYIDLKGTTPGEHQYDVKMDSIPGVQIRELNPQSVTLHIDTVQEKMLPVQPNIIGSPAEGKQIENAIVKPSTVNVRGPGSVLVTLDKVVVDVNVAGATDTVTKSLPVLFRDKSGQIIFGPDPSIETLSASPGFVDVIVPIVAKGSASKLIPLKVLSKGDPAQGMVVRSLQAVPDQVQVWGTPEALKGFDALNIGPVDLTGLTGNKTYQISADKISLPAGVSFGPGTSFTVVASIGKAAQEKTLTGVPVVVKNVANDLVMDQSPGNIDITVKALPEVLNTLTTDQISLWVDASGLIAGNYTDVQVFWQLPPGIEMVSTPKTTFSLKAKQ